MSNIKPFLDGGGANVLSYISAHVGTAPIIDGTVKGANGKEGAYKDAVVSAIQTMGSHDGDDR